MFVRTHTFGWKNFSDRRNSSRRTPCMRTNTMKIGFLGLFSIICGYWWECNSSVPEKFWEEIWSCSIQKIIKNSSRRTPRRNFDHQSEKIQKKKSKMMKIDILLNLDVEVVAHSEVVQNTSKTPKLSISDHISSLKSELPLKNSSRKFVIFHFLAILRISCRGEKFFRDEFLVRTHTWKLF